MPPFLSLFLAFFLLTITPSEGFNQRGPVPYDVSKDSRPLDLGERDFEGLAVLVSSFDKYEPLWEPFFTFLKDSWPDLYTDQKHIPLYLLSQTKTYPDPRVQMKHNPQEKSWSHSMIKALSSMSEPYVLFLLDDYLLHVPLNEERLSAVYQETKRLQAVNVQLQGVNPDLDKFLFG